MKCELYHTTIKDDYNVNKFTKAIESFLKNKKIRIVVFSEHSVLNGSLVSIAAAKLQEQLSRKVV